MSLKKTVGQPNLSFTFIVAGIAILLALGGATTFIILKDRDYVLQSARDSVQNLSLVVNKEVEATVSLADHMLTHAATNIQKSPEILNSTERNLHDDLKYFQSILRSGHYSNSFGHMFILNANGYSIANSVSFPVIKIDASDRPYFTHHKNTPLSDLNISQLLRSKVTGENVLYLTRRINDSDGNFLGVVGVQFYPEHFDDLYSQLEIPPSGTVAIIRDDGLGVFRYPFIENFRETSLSGLPLWEQMKLERSGALLFPDSPYDGYSRVVGFKVSNEYPLVSAVTVTEDSILSNWLSVSVKIFAFGFVAAAVSLALTFAVYRQTRRLTHVTELSCNDPLTGLHNRRSFDNLLEEEWRRAIRYEKEISLLFIDIDFFKSFNDTYGHEAGDVCLQRVASVFTEHFGRAGEVVCRFGGEEFLILLPNTSSSEAQAGAKKVIEAVIDLGIPHKVSEVSDYVTVSIGISTMCPQIHDGASSLIKESDRALYIAKSEGRNRYVVASQSCAVN